MNRFIICMALLFAAAALSSSENHRLIILADMGNEPDEEQQMAHLLMYANEFDVEGLIAVTGKYLRPESGDPYKQKVHPELFTRLIGGYAGVYENLQKHADGWPEPDYLRSVVKKGQPGYGYEDVGEGKSSEGSELIRHALLKEDPRPLYIVVNAGSNTLAQALHDLQQEVSAGEMGRYIRKIRVYENGAQDNAGAYICHKYPEIFWIRSNYQTYCYGGPAWEGEYANQGDPGNLGPHTWQPYAYSGTGQHQWILEHVIGNHGRLGPLYPLRLFGNGRLVFMEGGGTIPWLGLINKGLFSIDHAHWGSWSGRFTREKAKNPFSKHLSVNEDEKQFTPFYAYVEDSDRWTNPESGKTYDNIFAPVWRWRRAFVDDFKCRMDWCVASFEEANHHPVASVNGNAKNEILFREVRAGERLDLDASASSDPDGDPLVFHWWIYPEAGTYEGDIRIDQPGSDRIEMQIPADAGGKEIHLILELKDQHAIASLYDYRRIVIRVQ